MAPISPVLIIGARSDIGRALAHAYAQRGCDIILAARASADLEADCADLSLRYNVRSSRADVDVTQGDPDSFFGSLDEAPGTVIMVAGLLGDQNHAIADDAAALRIMETNYVGPARYLLAAARTMSKPGSTIIGISSVAGDRGRGSNLVYGSAKAGFSAFLSGLRNRLAKQQIHVMTVKPGFVATRMTQGMDLPSRLTASPKQVADAVVRAHVEQRNEIYAKALWRPLMQVIRAIPEPLFKRMSL